MKDNLCEIGNDVQNNTQECDKSDDISGEKVFNKVKNVYVEFT